MTFIGMVCARDGMNGLELRGTNELEMASNQHCLFRFMEEGRLYASITLRRSMALFLPALLQQNVAQSGAVLQIEEIKRNHFNGDSSCQEENLACTCRGHACCKPLLPQSIFQDKGDPPDKPRPRTKELHGGIELEGKRKRDGNWNTDSEERCETLVVKPAAPGKDAVGHYVEALRLNLGTELGDAIQKEIDNREAVSSDQTALDDDNWLVDATIDDDGKFTECKSFIECRGAP